MKLFNSKIILILITFCLLACKNELQINVPNTHYTKLIYAEENLPSISVIGEFEGKILIMSKFYDANGNSVSDVPPIMVAVDQYTNGAYFQLPNNPNVKSFSISFWVKEEFLKNKLFLNQIIVRGKNENKIIEKHKIQDHFQFKNIELHKETGEMKSNDIQPIPEIIYKEKFD